MTDGEQTETTGDSSGDGDGRPTPEFEGQEVLAGDGEAEDGYIDSDE